MARYIDKCAVIAEIERLDNFWHLSKGSSGLGFVECLRLFINTLEIKEIDNKGSIK